MPDEGIVSSKTIATDLIADVAYSWKEIIYFRKLYRTLPLTELLEQSKYGRSYRRLQEIVYLTAEKEGYAALQILMLVICMRSDEWNDRDIRCAKSAYNEMLSQWQKK